MDFPRPNAFYRFLHKIYRWRPVSWFISVLVPPIDRFLFKISGKRITLVKILSGLPVVMLHTIGAKSGKPRDNPLIGIPAGDYNDNLVLIGSNWGREHNPGWYYNIKAHPKVKLSFKGTTEEYEAKEVENEEEYNAHWQKAVSYYSGYPTKDPNCTTQTSTTVKIKNDKPLLIRQKRMDL